MAKPEPIGTVLARTLEASRALVAHLEELDRVGLALEERPELEQFFGPLVDACAQLARVTTRLCEELERLRRETSHGG